MKKEVDANETLGIYAIIKKGDGFYVVPTCGEKVRIDTSSDLDYELSYQGKWYVCVGADDDAFEAQRIATRLNAILKKHKL